MESRGRHVKKAEENCFDILKSCAVRAERLPEGCAGGVQAEVLARGEV